MGRRSRGWRTAPAKWTQPYAVNITAALQTATLNRDLSQNLDGVYTSSNPLSYPISAYSYIITKCAANAQFPTCKGTYSDPGSSNTLGTWMSYIACAGQVHMAEIGYAPLPPNLSQDMANSVARITGGHPVTLTASNCANPRFQGLLGVGAAGPPDPYLSLQKGTSGGGSSGGGSSGGAPSTTTPTSVPAGRLVNSDGGVRRAFPGVTTAATAGGQGGTSASTAGSSQGGVAAGGSPTTASGSGAAPAAESAGAYRRPQPVAYRSRITGGVPLLPLLALLVILIVPALRWGIRGRLAARRRS